MTSCGGGFDRLPPPCLCSPMRHVPLRWCDARVDTPRGWQDEGVARRGSKLRSRNTRVCIPYTACTFTPDQPVCIDRSGQDLAGWSPGLNQRWHHRRRSSARGTQNTARVDAKCTNVHCLVCDVDPKRFRNVSGLDFIDGLM